jgi:transcription initiation factor IIF auxiliary subunit
MVGVPIAVQVKDSIFDPDSDDRTVRVKQQAGRRPLYRVFLYLDGPDLPFVDSATYALHSSFPDPVRTVTRGLANPRCKLEIWTWGTFRVNVTIFDRNSHSYPLYHDLHYDDEFSEANVKFLREPLAAG